MEDQFSAMETGRGSWLTRFRPRALTPVASAHLDAIRALAAWAVMWGHVRSDFFVDFEHVRAKGLAVKVLYFSTGFGHQAVIVFFVLSGFLISSSVLHGYASGRWSWRDYAINRLSRLYAVLIPGLLFGLVLDRLGSTVFSASGLYSHPLDGFGSAIAQDQITVGVFVGNLFFLQTILCPTFGSNGPLWSLANEFWYYVLFPVVLFAAVGWMKHSVRRAVPLTVLAVATVVFLGRDKLVGFSIWMAGCGLVLAYSRFQKEPKPWLTPYAAISSLALVGCLMGSRLGRPVFLGTDLSVGIAFSLFLFGVLQVGLGKGLGLYRRSAHFLARFSYSLYVLHFPFLYFLRAWMAPIERWQPNGSHLVYGAAAGAAAVIFAWLVSTFTESRTSMLRQWIRGAMPQLASD